MTDTNHKWTTAPGWECCIHCGVTRENWENNKFPHPKSTKTHCRYFSDIFRYPWQPNQEPTMTTTGTLTTEQLHHFNCGNPNCKKWWSIGDAHLKENPHHRQWHCPWCGTKQNIAQHPNQPTIERTH